MVCRTLLVMTIILLVVAASVSAVDPVRGFRFDDKVVLTYYYIWFSENSWLNDPIGKFANVTPLVGAYNSWEPWIIEKHLAQMQRAKIDAVAVSWWNEAGPQKKNETLDMVFDSAKDKGLKITVDYEHGRMPIEQVVTDLTYFVDRYKSHPAMLKVEGLPVVMVWTAWGHTPEEWRDIFGRLEKKGLACFPIMSGSYEEGKGSRYLNPFRALEIYTLCDLEDCKLAEFMQTMRKHIDDYNQKTGFKIGKPAQHHATISPGYDERRNPGRLTKNGGVNGAGWKDRTKFGAIYPDDAEGAYYRGTFEAAMSSNPDWLHISTFNELGENSHIEATLQFGYKYIDLTAELVEKFKKATRVK
jgi:hypothetical protein